MRTIFLIFCFVIVILTNGCSPPFIIQFPEKIDEIDDNPEQKPEWVGREYWEENGYIYIVGKAEKTPVGEDVQLRFAELEARQKLLEISKLCRATIINGVLLQSWIDSDGTVYVLVRATGVIPWKNCPLS